MSLREDLARCVSVGVGEMHVTLPGGKASVLVGSCVALILWSKRRRVAVVSHILLPHSRDGLGTATTVPLGRYADTAVTGSLAMLRDLAEAANVAESDDPIVAYIIGGGELSSGDPATPIGDRNHQAVVRALNQAAIPISERQMGGERARRVLFDAADGTMQILTYDDLSAGMPPP